MKFISREAWGARAPRHRTGLSPTVGTTIHYEGVRLGNFPHSSCASKVRGIQAFHMDRKGWSDIAYTAVVCPHGYVFEGRWIGVRTGANGTNTGNATAYAACGLMGPGDTLTAAMVGAFVELCHLLRNAGRAGRGVNGHQDWKATQCPGSPLYGHVRAGTFEQAPAPPARPARWLPFRSGDTDTSIAKEVASTTR